MTRLAIAALAALCTLAVTATATAIDAGGISLTPAILERDAQPGPLGTIRVANDSSRAVAITVHVRPWIQARDGTVTPDGRQRLSHVRLSATAFTLAPGAARTISATLSARPGRRSIYGAIEVTGTPKGPRPSNGIRTRYRLLGALRLNPPAVQRKLRVAVGTARTDRKGVVLAVRNTGNTAQPVIGSARISGPAGTVRTTLPSQRILPGATVNVRLRRGRLQPGRYTATIALRQGGRHVATVTRRFRQR
jgi:hypothetical protein